jgi:hypothetical protein
MDNVFKGVCLLVVMVKKRKNSRGLGGWAFLVGVVLAVLLGFTNTTTDIWIWLLVVIGIIVGFLNVTEKQMEPFLFGGIALIIAGNFGGSVVSTIPQLAGILDAMLAIFVPATIIVAIKHVFSIAHKQ